MKTENNILKKPNQIDIEILTQDGDNSSIRVGRKVIKCKTITLCEYCFYPKKNNDLLKCSGNDCGLLICKSCLTFINHKPFCNECTVDIVKNKMLFMITKREGDI